MTGKPQGASLGYVTRPIAKRATRPLHRRENALERAEAIFKPKVDAKPAEKETNNG